MSVAARSMPNADVFTLIPAKHLQNFSSTSTPSVCIIGDSTASDGALNDLGAATGGGYFWDILQRRMTEDNPSSSITFTNYAIGGSTWGTINGDSVPTSYPSWWTNHGNTWLSYVQTLAPDTLVIMTGVNGTYSTALDTIKSVLTTICGWTKVPDIIFVTNRNATNDVSVGAPYNTSAWQIGARSSAAIERLIAKNNGKILGIANLPNIGLIDIGRTFTMVQQGYDPTNQYLEDVASAVVTGISAFPYTLPTSQEGDYYIDYTLVGAATAFASGAGITTITTLLSQPPSGSASGSWLNITPNGGTSFTARAYAGTGISTAISGGTIGSGDIRIQIEARQEQIKVTINNVVIGILYAPRYVAQFQPVVSLVGTVGAVTLNVTEYAQGIPVPSVRTWIDLGSDPLSIYGNISGTGNHGGNGINHPSSIGVAAVDDVVLRSISFAGSLPPPATDNRVVNGRMEIDQANEGASVADLSALGIVVDKWYYQQSGQTNRMTFQRVSDAPIGFANSLKVTVISSSTPTATQFTQLWQSIEGPLIADLGFGAAGAKPVFLEFFAKSSLTGAFPVSLFSKASARSYLSTYTINTANAWQRCIVAVPGDIAGTWSIALGSSGGMQIVFGLGVGSNQQTANLNIWQNNDYAGTASTVQLVGTLSATLQLTGVRLFQSPVWLPSAWRTYGQELILAQRSYRKSFPAGTAPVQNGGVAGALTVQNPIAAGKPSSYVSFDHPMAAAPTVTTFNPSAANANWRDITAAADVAVSVDPATTKSTTGVQIATGATVTTLGDQLAIHYTADAGF